MTQHKGVRAKESAQTPSTTLAPAPSDLFTREGKGIGLSFMRIPMGASDIALSVYSFDDLPAGKTDPTLAKFSIAHDQEYILPLIQQAKTLNPEMKLMANPWSPPGWMKTTGSMIGGSLLTDSTTETAFANYFVKYIKAYEAAGVPIDYISLQNEPLYLPPAYPGMSMDYITQTLLLKNCVLPALKSNNLSTKVLVYDHNWDTPTYPEIVLDNMNATQMEQIGGVAWHGYGGTAKFYLDSMSGTPIATVTLPVTGGWQTWTTVSAAATGASGVHTVYLVFAPVAGSTSIANVNWFQFQ